MGRPLILNDFAKDFILDNYQGMSIATISNKLSIKPGTIRCFLSDKGLSKFKRRKYVSFYEEPTPEGCFNVNDRDNWVM